MSISIAVLASGRGSNLQAIIDAIQKGEIDGKVVVVLCNKENAYALERAKHANIPAYYVNPKIYDTAEEYEDVLLNYINRYNCDLVCLAGYMKILTPYFIDHAPCPIMNIHPSLLPSFPGLHAHQQALDYGVKYSGCTVHFVDKGVDSGAIILQGAVEVLSGDNEDTLSDRILVKEHELYPKAIQLFAKNLLEVHGRQVIIKE